MLQINISLFLICLFSSVLSQEIQNVTFTQTPENIIIKYDLIGESPGDHYIVRVFCSTDRGYTWGNPLQCVKGDVGPNQIISTGKTIVWDVWNEMDIKKNEKICFKIEAISSNSTLDIMFNKKKDSIFDNRDSKIYEWMWIGRQIWMIENLNIGTFINSYKNQKNNGILEKFCYDNDELNCSTYGGLYSWDEAMNYSNNKTTKGICPIYWHIPTEEEWGTLISYLKGQTGGKLKETGTLHWSEPNLNATNESGFTALPGGYYVHGEYSSGFFGKNSSGFFWTSQKNLSGREFIQLENSNDTITYKTIPNKEIYFSVRCIKDM